MSEKRLRALTTVGTALSSSASWDMSKGESSKTSCRVISLVGIIAKGDQDASKYSELPEDAIDNAGDGSSFSRSRHEGSAFVKSRDDGGPFAMFALIATSSRDVAALMATSSRDVADPESVTSVAFPDSRDESDFQLDEEEERDRSPGSVSTKSSGFS